MIRIRRTILLLATTLVLGCPSLSKAQGPEGAHFLRSCGAAVKEQDGLKVSDQEAIESLWCIGYVSGFLDSMSITQSSAGGRKVICLPQQGITNEQAIRIFVKYLRDNPQTLHETGRMSLFIALGKAFPCR